jgi:hypothetical protein
MASKAIDLSLSLSASLARRGFVVTNGSDASGNATIQVGAGTIGSQSAFIRTLALPSIGTDAFGLTQRSFGPHIIQVVLETSTVANVALLLESAKLPLMAEVVGRGTIVEVYLSANGNAADVTDITTANLKATFNGLNADFGASSAV